MEAISPLWNQLDAVNPLWERSPARPLRPVEEAVEKNRPENTGVLAATPFSTVFGNVLDAASGPEGGPVTDIFRSAVAAVRETDAEKVEMEYLTATGQIDNPTALIIALSKAQLSVNLLVQLRNRALDAYSELTRLSL